MDTTSENKEVVVRFLDALGRGDVAAASDCFDAERYYSHHYEADLAGTWPQQKAEFQAGTWSDVVIQRVAVVAEDDRVFVHIDFTATHTGTFLGVAASGERVTLPLLQVWRVDGGKIVEHWGGFVVSPSTFERLVGR